jgi:phage-related protein
MKQIFWIKAADKELKGFPQIARDRILEALDAAALGGKSDISKPMQGLGSGIFEVALAYKSDAFRCVYAVQIGNAIWVVHAFQKKSTVGISTPKHEIDLIKLRLKRLKDELK